MHVEKCLVSVSLDFDEQFSDGVSILEIFARVPNTFDSERIFRMDENFELPLQNKIVQPLGILVTILWSEGIVCNPGNRND